MLKLFCLITGDNYQMVKNETPNSKKKIAVMATVLFIPVALWFVNGYFMVSEIIGGSAIGAILAGTIMAFLIFLIERAIVMSVNNRWIAIFRISLGFIIASLGAIVLDEIVFKDDIEQQMAQIEADQLIKKKSEINSSFASELARLQQDVDKKHKNWQVALADVKKEADGSGGTGNRGIGPITQLKLSLAESEEKNYQASVAALNMLNAKIDAQKAESKEKLESSMKHTALLNRIKALFQLIASDVYMLIIYVLFTLGIVLLEFMVVILKMGWPKTSYEKRLELLDEISERKMERIRKNNPNFIEVEKTFPQYNQAVNFLESQKQTSLFN